MRAWNVACEPGEHVATIVSGRGASLRCSGKHGLGASANGAWFLASVDVGWASPLAVFSVVELAVRASKRRS